MPSQRRSPRAVRALLAALTSLATLAVLAPSVAAGNPITFNLTIGGGCVAGTATPNFPVSVKLRNGLGDVVASKATTAGGTGAWVACLSVAIEIGDSIAADDGPNNRIMTIPKINGTLDRVTDLLSVKGLPSTSLVLRLEDCSFMALCQQVENRLLVVDAAGTGSFDYSGTFNVKGQDQVVATHTTASGDKIDRQIYAAYTRVVIGRSAYLGVAKPGTLVTTTLKTSADVLKGTGQVVAQHPVGNWSEVSFRKPNGTQVYVAAGDKVDADSSSDAGFTVTAVTISMNTSTDIIAGECRPNGTYSLAARRPDFSDVATRTGTANPSGDLAHDITADMDLIAGDLVTLQCRNGTGDVSERRVVAP